jgi:hypothetical protein
MPAICMYVLTYKDARLTLSLSSMSISSPPGLLYVSVSNGYTRMWCRAVINGRLRAISPLRRTPRLGPEWVNVVNQPVPDRSRQWPNLCQISKGSFLIDKACRRLCQKPRYGPTYPVDPMIGGKLRRHICSKAPCGIKTCR